MRRAAGQPLRGFLDLHALCRWAGACVQITTLGASRGQEGLLTPLPNDRFGISIDPAPAADWAPSVPMPVRSDLLRHRARFRIAHELGHILFYRRRSAAAPKRLLFDSPAQEAFCDHFGRHLLAPPGQAALVPATPEGLVELQRACDVSLEVAARAVADAQPDLSISIWREDPQQKLRLQWASSGQGRQSDPATPGGIWLKARGQFLSVT